MSTFKSILLAGVMSIAMVGTAAAADFSAAEFSSPSDSSWYIRGDLGWSFLDLSGGPNDDDFTFGGGVGYQYSEYWRTDLRVDYAGDFDVQGGADLGFGTILLNGYFDIPINNQIAPYIGAGVGYGWTTLQPGPDRDGVAYSLMGGVGAKMTEQITLDVGYRWRGVSIEGPNVRDHSILAGGRFSF